MARILTSSRRFLALASAAVARCRDDNVSRMSAALAYYSLFTLAPAMFIAVAFAGAVIGSAAAHEQLRVELELFAGPTLAHAIEAFLAFSYRTTAGASATVVGLGALAFGGSGIFLELRESLNVILGSRPPRRSGIVRILKARSLAFLMVLGGSAILLAGMVASTALQNMLVGVDVMIPGAAFIVALSAGVILFAISTVLFALLYRQLPRPKPGWKASWAGAVLAAALFVALEFFLSYYLGRAAPASALGAAGSIFAVLLWVYFSAQIVYLGAEFTKCYGSELSSGATNLSP
jgi:membrane protein